MEYKPWRDMTTDERKAETLKRKGNPQVLFESKKFVKKDGGNWVHTFTQNKGINKKKRELKQLLKLRGK